MDPTQDPIVNLALSEFNRLAKLGFIKLGEMEETTAHRRQFERLRQPIKELIPIGTDYHIDFFRSVVYIEQSRKVVAKVGIEMFVRSNEEHILGRPGRTYARSTKSRWICLQNDETDYLSLDFPEDEIKRVLEIISQVKNSPHRFFTNREPNQITPRRLARLPGKDRHYGL